jgi:hypothetical protein
VVGSEGVEEEVVLEEEEGENTPIMGTIEYL